MVKESTDKEFVDGLARGLDVIAAFDMDTPEMTLSEVARKTGHSPAAARRSIFTLIKLGFMRSADDKRFVLTPKILLLGSSYLRAAHIEDALMPELRIIIQHFGDAASVGVLVDTNVLYVAHQSSPNALRPVAGTGVTYPAHVTSMGRVLLASFSDVEFERYMTATPLRPMTDATVTDPKVFRALIAEVRQNGYATSVDQLAYGVTSLAVPITLADGETVAALNTSGYTGRVTPQSLVDDRLEPLRDGARRIAEILHRYPGLRQSLRRERR